ncbi:MAG: DJ-1/PfpI family protein [Ghiorsea sp.]
MTKRVLVPFTTGVEEIELVAVVDILRRADIEVCLASLDELAVTGRSNITIQADVAINTLIGQNWDMLILPGGLPNAHLLRDNQHVKTMVLKLAEQRKHIAAICAAPTALAAYGITKNKRVTSYPSCQKEMLDLQPSSIYVDDIVVEDDFLITSRGAGTAVEFALYLVATLCGKTKAEEVRQSIVA